MLRGAALPPWFPLYMKVLMIIGGCFGILFALAMPAYITIVLTRKRVRDAFNGVFPTGGAFDLAAGG